MALQFLTLPQLVKPTCLKNIASKVYIFKYIFVKKHLNSNSLTDVYFLPYFLQM